MPGIGRKGIVQAPLASTSSLRGPSSCIKTVHKFMLCTDSRGRELGSIININRLNQKLCDINSEARVDSRIFSGGKFEKLIEECNKHNNYDYFIIIGGICNLTSKCTLNGEKSLTYTDRSRATGLLNSIDNAIQSLQNKLHIATIIPASLIEYQRYYNRVNEVHNNSAATKESLAQNQQQADLNKDCSNLNQHIINKNIERDYPTLPLHSKSFLSTKKVDKRTKQKRTVWKFSSRNLVDGVHPDRQLKEAWALLIEEFIVKLARKRYNKSTEREGSPTAAAYQQRDSSDTEDSSEENSASETYNFKRRNAGTRRPLERVVSQSKRPRYY